MTARCLAACVIAWRKRTKHDPVTHVWRWMFIVEKFVDGQLVETEANERWCRRTSIGKWRSDLTCPVPCYCW